ncbi:MAG: hypothetical protein JWM85_3137 [Acidimicrobiaceae bacterium]|nr:hypothetical protein [Acidimicrobiaceae bacterium]
MKLPRVRPKLPAIRLSIPVRLRRARPDASSRGVRVPLKLLRLPFKLFGVRPKLPSTRIGLAAGALGLAAGAGALARRRAKLRRARREQDFHRASEGLWPAVPERGENIVRIVAERPAGDGALPEIAQFRRNTDHDGAGQAVGDPDADAHDQRAAVEQPKAQATPERPEAGPSAS